MTDTPSEVPETTPEPVNTPEAPAREGGAPETADGRDARIAELEKRLADAEPILKAHADAEEARKTELQKANERAAALERELSAAREAAARSKVAAETGLSADVVALLRGSTEEELMAAARKVADGRPSANLRTRTRPTVGAGASQPGSEPSGESPEELAKRIRKAMPY